MSNPNASTNSASAHLTVYDALADIQTYRYFGEYLYAGLKIRGQRASNYVLYCTTDLSNPNGWIPLMTNTMGASDWFYFDPNSVYWPHCFYKVMLKP